MDERSGLANTAMVWHDEGLLALEEGSKPWMIGITDIYIHTYSLYTPWVLELLSGLGLRLRSR